MDAICLLQSSKLNNSTSCVVCWYSSNAFFRSMNKADAETWCSHPIVPLMRVNLSVVPELFLQWWHQLLSWWMSSHSHQASRQLLLTLPFVCEAPNRVPLGDIGHTMPSLLYISIRRLASSVKTCHMTLKWILLWSILNLVYILSRCIIFFTRQDSSLIVAWIPTHPYMCVYILFRITHYQITTPVRSGVSYWLF